jgi:hypothetical protein
MLWVDLPDAISLHPVMSVTPGERRLERIKSPDPRQHRISYGCINVPEAYYDDVVLTALSGGSAVVYILPDTKRIDDVFPAFAATLGNGHEGDLEGQQLSRANPLTDSANGFDDSEPSRLDPANDQPGLPPPPPP